MLFREVWLERREVKEKEEEVCVAGVSFDSVVATGCKRL